VQGGKKAHCCSQGVESYVGRGREEWKGDARFTERDYRRVILERIFFKGAW